MFTICSVLPDAGAVGVGGLAAAAVVASSHPPKEKHRRHHRQSEEAEEGQNAVNDGIAESSQPQRSESPRDLNRLVGLLIIES